VSRRGSPDGYFSTICDCPDEPTAQRIKNAILSESQSAQSKPAQIDESAARSTTPHFTLPEVFFTPCDDSPLADNEDEEDKDRRLTAVISINDCRMHVEAIPVRDDEDGHQQGLDITSASRLDALSAEFGVTGFDTITIDGQPYVLVITPFEL